MYAAMISAVVFSKDRPLQLDALLRSIRLHAPSLYDQVTVLVACSNDDYRRAYGCCRYENDGAEFLPERDFRSDLIALLPGDGLTALHCDDDLFFRPFSWPAIWGSRWTPELFAFSLRLGRNTRNHYQPEPGEQEIPQTNPWVWERATGDFGYPFSLDGHIYPAGRLRTLLSLLSFSNPNELEAAGDWHVRRNPSWGSLLACPERSCVVSIPANRVQDQFANRHADRDDWRPEVLLERYLAGQRINLDALDGEQVTAAHQEIELAFS